MEQIAVVALDPEQIEYSELWIIPKDKLPWNVREAVRKLQVENTSPKFLKRAKKTWEEFASCEEYMCEYCHVFKHMGYFTRDINVIEFYIFPRFGKLE